MKLFAIVLASLALVVPAAGQTEHDRVRENTRKTAPALEKYRDTALLNGVWKRPGLTARDRSIVTLAAMITRRDAIELPFYLDLALDNGLKPDEISEIITHLAFYAGWGSAMAAVDAAKDVFTRRKIETSALAAVSPTLLPLNEATEANRAKMVGDQFGNVSPGLVQDTTDVLFRDLWLRPDLAPRDRSLVTISALIASGQVAQLTAHANIGMNNGLTQTEIGEAIAHLAFYTGWPNAFSAMSVAKDVFEKRPR